MDSGYQVCVVAPEDEYAEKIKAEGIPFFPVRKLKRFSINPVHDLILYKEYVKVYSTLKPAFIFHYTIKPNIYGTLAARFCQIKCISITTGLGNAFAIKGLLRSFAKKLYKFSSLFALEVWFLNSTDRELFIKNHIIPEHKSFVLPGEGINTSRFKSLVSVYKSGSNTFLLFSRMQYDKGVQTFVEATRILKKKGYDFSAQLLGQLDMNNPEAISLDTIDAWQQEGIISYLGTVTDVKAYIDSADIIVLPSYYMEGVPRVLLEAACMCKPIITTRNTGCAEVVDDGVNGYLCEAKNVEDLALQMEKFLHLPSEEREKMGIAGRRKVEEKFDEKIIIDIYKSKLEQYLG